MGDPTNTTPPSLRDALAPLGSPARSVGPVIRSVSQATFEVGGDAPFDSAVREAVVWMRKRNRAIPKSALTGAPFEVGGGGDTPGRAVTLEFDGGQIWAASLDDPDKNIVGRTWVTEITVAEQNNRVLFGARLINVTRRTDASFVPSLPGISRQIVSKISTIADDISLTEHARRITTPDEVDDLIALLDDPKRKLAVVVIADAINREQFALPDEIAKRLAGGSHVVSIDTEASWELTRRIGKELSVFDGAARFYRTGFRSDISDPFEHPLFIPRDGTALDTRSDLLVTRVLAVTVNTGRKDDYPRFNSIRQAAAAKAIAAQRLKVSGSDLSQLFEEENERLTEELKSLRDEFDQWLEDMDVSRLEAERDISEVKSEIARARAQNESLRVALVSGQITSREPLGTFEDFEEWARSNLSTSIWIAPKAFKELDKNQLFHDPTLLGDALYMLDDLHVPMRRSPSVDKRTAYEARLQELNCLDQPCFSERKHIRGFPAYSVTYQGEKFWCDLHIKHGSGTDPRRFFRILLHMA